ncbi:alkaline phosphatase family protein [Natranaeroarchaeum sulfidigenes]|uniref:Phosphodiesterase of AP superfamily n=1 Tax=Natranaeroarchaeum sulfidigenes TaxID=2784880 RepID=A0A897MXW7_9EURY|nr:alkaline phosphatase family protein [Natranaeroarchaeum sulfidigenes]QSG03759.1 Phosphodiesterase of AP superfamily [Natranaeroarchaeum sulfidigenes]
MGLFDRLRGEDVPRVAFFGIDGVPYSLLADRFDEFENLAAIAEEGGAGPIDSIVPPESSACWPSLTTGKNPGKTGVYGFQDREVGSYDTYVPMGRDVQAERVWDVAQDNDRKATVMNVPVTFPPQRNVQRMVSGFLSPGIDKAAYPDELADYLQGIDYRIDANAKLGHSEDKSEFIENAHETLDRRFEAFSHYLEQDDWDLFFGVFMTTDRVNHFLFEDYERDGEYKEEFLDFYRKLDDYLGQLREMLGDDVTMAVASDHGFTTLDYEVHLNAWLQQEGWLSFEDDEHDELGDIADDTRAYSLIPGRIYLNLEGREPRGSVPEDEYEAVRGELKAELEALEGPDGNPVAERVVEKEDAFRGDHDDIAPDLVVIPNHGYDLKAGFKGHDEVFGTGPRNGMHTFGNASLFIDHPEAEIKDADLLDITPTILDLLDIEYDRPEYDGASLV